MLSRDTFVLGAWQAVSALLLALLPSLHGVATHYYVLCQRCVL
jgi:hypothetical protein